MHIRLSIEPPSSKGRTGIRRLLPVTNGQGHSKDTRRSSYAEM